MRGSKARQQEREFKAYSGLDSLPCGRAEGEPVRGCLVLEGGAFRGVYTSGVLDAMMEGGVNLECVIGVSAGALNGMNYLSRQIGRSARINLKYRHDPEYVGPRAYKSNKGIIGFDFLLKRVNRYDPFDYSSFFDSKRRFVAVATSFDTGRPVYFERGVEREIFNAVKASASLPFVSRPVRVGNGLYLDGGCTVKIPFDWAMREGYSKIIVIKTKPSGSKSKLADMSRLAPAVYRGHPEFARSLYYSTHAGIRQQRVLDSLARKGRVLLIQPSRYIPVSRLEPDMEKLGELYYLGYSDGKEQLPRIMEYLGMK